jgi:hypothetical protein
MDIPAALERAAGEVDGTTPGSEYHFIKTRGNMGESM